MIIPFESVEDCKKYSARTLDIIVYHSHDTNLIDIDTVLALKDTLSSGQLVVLTDATAPELNAVNDAIVKGVSAFVLAEKSCLDVLIMVLNLVALGGRFVPVEFLFGRRVPRMLVAEKPPRKLHTTAKLTPREVEVVSLLKLGKGNELIAQALGISDATAKIHVSNVIRKMGAVNRTQAALNAD